MDTPPRAPARTRHSAGLVIAAVLSWVPAVAVVASLILRSLPASIPTHWGTSGADAWSAPAHALWPILLPGAIGGLLVTAIVAVSGDDLPRIKGGLGLGAIVLVAGGITLTWFASLTIARHPGQTTQAFTSVLLSAGALAVLVFGAAALPRHARQNGDRSG